MNKILFVLCAIIISVTIIVLLLMLMKKHNSKIDDGTNAGTNSGANAGTNNGANKEGFFTTASPAVVSPTTGALVGQHLMTDQITRASMDNIIKQVNETSYANDGSLTHGVGLGNGFDMLYDNQREIQEIDSRSKNGYQTRSDLKEISQRIASGQSNANHNVYTRAGSTPTKLYIATNQARCVVDEKYVSERNKNRQISTVGTVIPTQGYDINVDRIGEELTDTHFSAVSVNGRQSRNRIPTMAGATGQSPGESANAKVVNNQITVQDGNIIIDDTVARKSVSIPL